MTTRILLPLFVLILAACNNSGSDADTAKDTADTKMTEDTTHSMNMTNVPNVPAVPANAKVYFKNLKANATVSSPFKVEMAVDNMKIDTAGPIVDGSGHYHIFIDAEDSLANGAMVPKDSTHLHYGKGQTETELKLTPGTHKLTLQFADGLHRSYGSQLSAVVTVNVKK